MLFRPLSSRRRYQHYREAFKQHETEGSSRTAAAHAKSRHHAHRSFMQLFRAFLRIAREHRASIILAMFTVTVATGLKLIPPAATGFVLDNILGSKPIPADLLERFGIPADPRELLVLIALGLVIVATISVSIGMWGRYLATRTNKRIQSQLRKRVFAHAVRLPLHRIFSLKSGGVASVLREDAGGVGELVFSMLYNPWRAIVQLGGTLVILAFIDWRLLVGSLIIIPTVYFTHRTWIARIRPMWRDIRASRQDMDGHAAESFGGMRVVRSFGRQRTETGRFIRNNHLMIRQEMSAWWWSRGVDIAWSVLVPFATAGLLLYGGMRIIADEQRVQQGVLEAGEALTAGGLVMFLFYLAMLLEPIATLATSATGFQNSLAGLDRILDLLEEPREFQDAPGSMLLRPEEVDGRVTLREVSFTYPKTKSPVLRDIDLDVAPGQIIAFVGPSGSGKTTLCNLIARFFDPTEGVIELDGIDLREIDVESYRRLLGVVEQDIFLFDGTIGENIAYGRRQATMDEIAEAAHLAHAAEFIERFDRGYDTVIGERGVRLSGGQRQRLAIARALLADPRILILDEATSNLDTESERLIQLSLETLMKDRTSFVIAHRLSTITHADLIVVLEHGEVVEQGTHAELMARSGAYQRMVEMQLLDARTPLEEEPADTHPG
jgi:ATP-binding cassette subfamily B protein/subfamily B ATP-binding cassette protein MsbA